MWPKEEILLRPSRSDGAAAGQQDRAEDQSPIVVLQSTHEGRGQPVAEPDIVRWLLTEARTIKRDAILLDELCWRIVGAGVPLWRATLHVGTLHPQILGFNWRWRRDHNLTEVMRVAHAVRTSEDFLRSPIRPVVLEGKTVRHRLDRADEIAPFPLLVELSAAGGTDYLAAPLDPGNDRHHAVTWASDNPGGFSEHCDRLLRAITPALGTLMEGRSMRRVAGHLLDTYVGRKVGQRLLEGHVIRGMGERIRAAILCTDLRGFTRLSDRLPGDEIIALLDDYFEAFADPVHAEGGEVLKFVGDGLLAIFAVDGRPEPGAAAAALAAAERGIVNLAALNTVRERAGRQALRAGVGLHLGDVIYGNVGSSARLDFTAIGPAVNLASRLEGLTKRLDRPLLMSREFARTLQRPALSLGFQPVRGMARPEEIFGLP
jgi:adenylate cyclase